ncbi:hypothetical protein A2X44_04380 [candidate division CPR3 bacterium GWF2_35_18]|uniref:LiaI-LiaF-like transmembrane region domain-containing protein n=1 Tax=candidate division CPR3 bacterium GW2011_GWF2_35_18 TaxID=1618350 RepID=A0A0G0BZR8_UNCC3|nr:MAG: hypothetical protein UR67_C0007G0066 [candidate division CPR3 bacterium GW2011_GWF2_35_18]KKP87012.1 MAG: hypothetical protein UR87_C0006G0005 [candidate division CPR3 bacterium GW2011_GWE2_35_7]OGB62591.1 MAG: hypothetical protein A2X44_04380 [candidate division CPR3 bacterium GWF2_35_18]OGB65842.1 MAG: hypothetical protein A2250_01630 [candidate division CPR3 bacterium RIFOXYA2_FULL_35_13]OGB77231.1 MAG: hypothetical protein A2476_01570 [candidate division CPR3 bacterium RIFOXYC2_FULL
MVNKKQTEEKIQPEEKEEVKESKQNDKQKEDKQFVKEIHYIKEDHGSNPFGAFILIGLGVIFLLNNFNILPWSVWGTLWRFWPVFLILGGLQIVLGKSFIAKWLVAILGLATITIIVCLSLSSVNSQLENYMHNRFSWWPENSVFNLSEQELKQDQITVAKDAYEGVLSRELTVDIGVSEFSITDDDTYNYLDITSSYYDDFGKPSLEKRFKDGVLSLDFSTESGVFFFGRIFDSNKVKYDFSMGQTGIPTDINIDLGTGKGTVNFDKMNLNTLNAEVGTGSISFNLGQYALPSSKITIKIGTGSAKITLPKNTELKLKYEIGTGKIELNDTEIKGDGNYISDKFDSSTYKVEFDVDIGTGSMEIVTE